MLEQPLEHVCVCLRGRIVQVDGMSRVTAMRRNYQVPVHPESTRTSHSRRDVRLKAASVGVQRLNLGRQVGTVAVTPTGAVDEIVRPSHHEDVSGKVGSGLGRCDGSSESDYIDVAVVSRQ